MRIQASREYDNGVKRLERVREKSIQTGLEWYENDKKYIGDLREQLKEQEAAKESTGGKHKIYLIAMDQMDQHWVNVDAGVENAVEELDCVEYTWLAPDVKDNVKQIEQTF